MKARVQIGLVFLILLALLTPMSLLAGGQEEAKKTGTIKLWHGDPKTDVVLKDMAAKDYETANPGVKVEVSSFPLVDFYQKLPIALPTGTGPDLIVFSVAFSVKYIEAGLFNKPPQHVLNFVKKSFQPIWIEDATYKDQIWGIPYLGELKVAFYNTDMYKEAGLSHAPRNWKEVIDFARKTTKYDASGNVERSGISLRLSGGAGGVAEKFWMWLAPRGATFLEEGKEFGKYHAGYDNEAGRATLKLYIDLLYKYKCDSFDIKHDAEALALEHTAYFQRESWVIGYMKEKAPHVNFDTAPLPVEKRNAGVLSSRNLNVSEKSNVKELAWDFAMFLEDEKYLEALLQKGVGLLPTRSDLNYEDILFSEEPRFKPAVEITKDFKGYSYPRITTCDEIQTKLAARLVPAFQDSSLLDNPEGIAKVLSEAAREANDIMKEAGEYGE